MAALGYAGLLPFYAAALYLLLALPGAQLALQVFLVYATVILAFLGGTLWGYAVTRPRPEKHRRLLLSNLVALFAAGCALLAQPLAAVILLALGQLAVLAYERNRGDCTGWYLRLRTRLTLGVMPAHLLVVLALLR